MKSVDLVVIVSIVGIVSSLSGLLLGWIGRARTAKQDTTIEAKKAGKLESTLEYILHGVDEVRVDQRAQKQRFDELSERVTRVEVTAESAHHRIDHIRNDTMRASG